MTTPDPNRSEQPFISVIVPVFNEAGAIDPFLEATGAVLKETGSPFEVVFIDDGSTDKTLDVLRAAKTHYPQILILALSRNFGKEAALTAGLDHAKGDVVIPIDVDLQDPPEVIHQFIEKWREGHDIVYGRRADRSSDGALKQASAGWFYKLFNTISQVPIPADAGDFRLMDRRVVDEIKGLREKTRFMKGLMAWPGYKSTDVAFERTGRVAGSTKFNFWKLWNFALDGITSFSSVPLRLWLYVGALISLLSFTYAAFIVLKVLITGADVPGYASVMVAVTFFGGIQLLSIGLVGEYVGRIFLEIKGRPIYLIASIE